MVYADGLVDNIESALAWCDYGHKVRVNKLPLRHPKQLQRHTMPLRPSTVPICRVCRTSSTYECRTLRWYLTTKSQECLRFVTGWFGAKRICPAVPQVWDQFKQLSYNGTSSNYNMYYGYDYSVYQRYEGICHDMQSKWLPSRFNPANRV